MNYIVRFIYHTYIFGFFFTFFPGREREEVGGAVYALLLFFFLRGEVSFFFITVSNVLLYPFVCPQRETVDV